MGTGKKISALRDRVAQLLSRVRKTQDGITALDQSIQASTDRLESRMQESNDGLRQMGDRLESQLRQNNETWQAQTNQLSEGFAHLQEAVSRHDLAIEDMLDSWEDWSGKQETLFDQVRNLVSASRDEEQEEACRREEALLRLIIGYQDQLDSLSRAASCFPANDQADGVRQEDTDQGTIRPEAAWSRQITLATEKMASSLALAGLQRTGRVGEAFSYDLHEALEVSDTADPALDRRIADVLTCGWIDRGKVFRKARVTVWRLVAEEEETK